MNELLQRFHAAAASRILGDACCPPGLQGEEST
jgi:hypothetical protein